MNHEKTFFIEIRNEIETIKKCITNAGFIERIVTRLIPMIRDCIELTMIIKRWEDEIVNEANEIETLAQNGCEELTIAFDKIWEAFVVTPRNQRRQGLLGPVYRWINNIPANRFLVGIMNEACGAGVCRYRKPPIEFVYERLQNIYLEHIERSWDFNFAPNAFRYLERMSARELFAKAESVPHLMWKRLINLANAWKLRNERLKVGIDRIRGEKKTILYRAHQADSQARFNHFALDLTTCDTYDGKQAAGFQRTFYHSILDGLFHELEMAIRRVNQNLPLPKMNENDHTRTRKYKEDLQTLVPICIDLIIRRNAEGKSTKAKTLIDIIKKTIENENLPVHDPNKTRIQEVIRLARAKIKGKHRETKYRHKHNQKKPLLKTSAQSKKRRPK